MRFNMTFRLYGYIIAIYPLPILIIVYLQIFVSTIFQVQNQCHYKARPGCNYYKKFAVHLVFENYSFYVFKTFIRKHSEVTKCSLGGSAKAQLLLRIVYCV